VSQPRPANQADAELILRLYELRREPEMRKARDWCNFQFSPQSLEDVQKVAMASGTDENRYLRQVMTYWEMAAALVISGALHRGLFEQTNGEYMNLYSKLKPFLPALRRAYGMPEFMHNLEQLVEGSEHGRSMLARFEKWMAARKAGS
jgi:hypothetical protein